MNKKIKCQIFSILLILLISFSLGGCGCSKQKNADNKNNNTSEQTISKDINNLTGLKIDESKSNLRPVCVMTNNMKKAQPLSGVFDADIVYECLNEGGITRIMSVFKDIESVKNIGSVRSARPYYINLAKGLNGIYVHLGGSSPAYSLLKSGYIDEIDLILGKYMWRDESRRKNLGLEHSAFTSGEKLSQGIAEKGFSKTLDNNYKYNPYFSDDSQVLNGNPAKKLTVKFSGYKSTIFNYDEKTQEYLVSQFDKPQMDANKSIQNSKKNVIVLRAKTQNFENTELLDINLLGSGEGYYMSQGKIIDIIWNRENENTSFSYKTKDGKDLSLLKGKFYICIVTPNTTVTAE